MSIGETLRQLRKKKNLTQIQFANLFQISNGTIAMWETDKRQPDGETLSKLADFFDVSVDYLLGREEKNSPENQESNSRGLYIPEKYRDVMVAFSGGTDDLTQEDIDAIVRFIEFTKNNKKK